jgi:hypothetical protein
VRAVGSATELHSEIQKRWPHHSVDLGHGSPFVWCDGALSGIVSAVSVALRGTLAPVSITVHNLAPVSITMHKLAPSFNYSA